MLAAYFLRLLPCVFVILIADCAISSDQKNDLIVGWRVGLLDRCLAGVRRQHEDWRVLSTQEAEQEVQFVRAAAAQQRVRLAAAAQRRARR